MKVYIVQLKSVFRGMYSVINSVHAKEEDAKKVVDFLGEDEERQPLARYAVWEVEDL